MARLCVCPTTGTATPSTMMMMMSKKTLRITFGGHSKQFETTAYSRPARRSVRLPLRMTLGEETSFKEGVEINQSLVMLRTAMAKFKQAIMKTAGNSTTSSSNNKTPPSSLCLGGTK